MLSESRVARLSLGPALVLLATGIWLLADRLGGIGPLDRAKATGLISVPLLLVTPAALSLGLAGLSRSAALVRAAVVGFGFAAIVGALLVGSGYHGTCAPPAYPEDLLPVGVVAAAVGASVAFSMLVASIAARRGHSWISVIGTSVTTMILGSAGALYAYASLFPIASCPRL